MLKYFSKTIKKQRIALNMSQNDLAIKTNLSRNYISDVERCKRNISLVNIEKILNALNLEIKFIRIDNNPIL